VIRGCVLFATVLLAAHAQAQQPAADEQAVQRVLSEQVAAWNLGDVPGYMAGYWHSDSTVFVSGGTRTMGFDSVLARYRRVYSDRDKMGTLTFEDLGVRFVSTSVAIATGVWRLQRTKDAPWGRFTLILERKSRGWRITYDHTSSGGT